MAPMAIDRKQNQHVNIMKPLIPRAESKRKAADDTDNISNSSKRIKSSHTVSPISEKRLVHMVPFPEKVSYWLAETASTDHLLTSEPIASRFGRAQWGD